MGRMLERVSRRIGSWVIIMYIREDELNDTYYEVWAKEDGDIARMDISTYDYGMACNMFELLMHRAANQMINEMIASFRAEFDLADDNAGRMAAEEAQTQQALDELFKEVD